MSEALSDILRQSFKIVYPGHVDGCCVGLAALNVFFLICRLVQSDRGSNELNGLNAERLVGQHGPQR